MSLLKTVALVAVAAAGGVMVSNIATPRVLSFTKLDPKNAGAVGTGVTAASATLIYVVLASVI